MKVINPSAGRSDAMSSTSSSGPSVGGVGSSKGIGSKKMSGETSLGTATPAGAKVDLSPRAMEIKKAKEVAKAAPDINEEKVAKFQGLIDRGEYKVDAKKVADRLVDEHVTNAAFDGED